MRPARAKARALVYFILTLKSRLKVSSLISVYVSSQASMPATDSPRAVIPSSSQRPSASFQAYALRISCLPEVAQEDTISFLSGFDSVFAVCEASNVAAFNAGQCGELLNPHVHAFIRTARTPSSIRAELVRKVFGGKAPGQVGYSLKPLNGQLWCDYEPYFRYLCKGADDSSGVICLVR